MSKRVARHGLTLLELVFALSITALVAVAISGMMGAIASGVDSRGDNRSVLARAHASQTRLSAYIATSRSFLSINSDSITVWLNDARESDTVHASEIRWFVQDQTTRTISVHYLSFPDEWGQIARELSDNEYSKDTDWSTVLSFYQSQGWTASYVLMDDVEVTVARGNAAEAGNSTMVELALDFNPDDEPVSLHMACAIHQPAPPTK